MHTRVTKASTSTIFPLSKGIFTVHALICSLCLRHCMNKYFDEALVVFFVSSSGTVCNADTVELWRF